MSSKAPTSLVVRAAKPISHFEKPKKVASQPQKNPQSGKAFLEINVKSSKAAKPKATAKPKTQTPSLPKVAAADQPSATGGNAPACDASNGAEYVLVKGCCQMKSSQDGMADVAANLSLIIHHQSGCGILTLSLPGKGSRSHNVLDLEPPVMRNDYCFVACRSSACRSSKGCHSYYVRLHEYCLTAKFSLYLESLQRAMSKLKPSSGTGHLSKPDTQIRDERVPILKEEPILINFSDASTTATNMSDRQSAPRLTLKDAAEQVLEFIDAIMPNIKDDAVSNCGDSKTDAEYVPGTLSLAQDPGNLQSDRHQSDLLEICQMLSLFKVRNDQHRETMLRKAHHPGSALEALRGLEIGPVTSRRIQYSFAELQNLAPSADADEGCFANLFLLQTAGADRYAASAITLKAKMPPHSRSVQIANGSNEVRERTTTGARKFLTGGNSLQFHADAPAAPGLADSMFSNTAGHSSEAIGAQSPQNGIAEAVEGLSSSRWA